MIHLIRYYYATTYININNMSGVWTWFHFKIKDDVITLWVYVLFYYLESTFVANRNLLRSKSQKGLVISVKWAWWYL